MMTGKFHRARVYVALLVVAAYIPAAQSVYAMPVLGTTSDSASAFHNRLNDSTNKYVADTSATLPIDSVAVSSPMEVNIPVRETEHEVKEDSIVYNSTVLAGVPSQLDSASAVRISDVVRDTVAPGGESLQIDSVALNSDSAALHIDSVALHVDSMTSHYVDSVPLNADSVAIHHIDSVAIRAKRDSLLTKARNLRMEYDFSSADSLLIQAVSYYPSPSDTLAFRKDSLEYARVESEKLLCENGFNMSRYVTFPEVVARRMFSTDDFFLWYPLPDRSWIHTPDSLDTGKDASFKLCYIPHDSDRLLFSSTEPSGYRSIFAMDAVSDTSYNSSTSTESLDSNVSLAQTDSLTFELAGRRWGNRHSVFGKLTSSSDEIFPMMSPDGNTIWFASSGLYGVGGYDLYESQWDEQTKSWSVPVNMGFPFSSPANDYLLTVTPDEKYMIFASDRGCPKDSVSVYVIVYDPVPVKSAVDSPEELRSVAELSPNVSAVAVETVAVADEPMESKDNKEYTEKMNLVRSLRDSISNHGAEMEALREEFVLSDDDDRRQELTMKILSMEKALPALQAAYAEASAALQKIEMEFLFNGVFIDANKAAEAADRKVVSASSSFVFTKKSMGPDRN